MSLSVDPLKLREEVKKKYREVALDPGGEHHFHTGRALARHLGYDERMLEAMPEEAVESFAGVANPFGADGILSEQVLFQNQGDGTFIDATYDAGLGGYEFAWGGSFADFDNDGDDDLITVGSVAVSFMQILGELAGPGRIYENDGDGQLEDVIDLGLELEATSGLAVADYDNDGFTDVVIIKTAFDYAQTPWGPLAGDGGPVLLHNEGNDNKSVTVRLLGSESNSQGIGAKVLAHVPGRGTQIREVAAGGSFASTNSPWPSFGLGNVGVAFIEVHWPSGIEETFVVPAAGGMRTLEEGTGFCL